MRRTFVMWSVGVVTTILCGCSQRANDAYYMGEVLVINDTVWFTDCAVEKVYTLPEGKPLRQIAQRLGESDVAGGSVQVECRGTLTDQQGHSQLSISEIIAMQPGSCNPNNLLCGVYSSSDPNQHDAASSQKLPSKLTLH